MKIKSLDVHIVRYVTEHNDHIVAFGNKEDAENFAKSIQNKTNSGTVWIGIPVLGEIKDVEFDD